MQWMIEPASDKSCWNNIWKKWQACVNINNKGKNKYIQILHLHMKLGRKMKITLSKRDVANKKLIISIIHTPKFTNMSCTFNYNQYNIELLCSSTKWWFLQMWTLNGVKSNAQIQLNGSAILQFCFSWMSLLKNIFVHLS
jgi:hypothetical protein